MSAPDVAKVKGQVRAAVTTLPVGFAFFIGGIVAIALKAVTLGEVLIAAAIVVLAVGCVLMFRVRNGTRAMTRDLQARRQADLDTAFRDHPGGRLP
jgi:hypothetical protein